MLDINAIQSRLETAAPLKSIEWVGKSDSLGVQSRIPSAFIPKLEKWLKNVPVPVRIYLGDYKEGFILQPTIKNKPPALLVAKGVQHDRNSLNVFVTFTEGDISRTPWGVIHAMYHAATERGAPRRRRLDVLIKWWENMVRSAYGIDDKEEYFAISNKLVGGILTFQSAREGYEWGADDVEFIVELMTHSLVTNWKPVMKDFPRKLEPGPEYYSYMYIDEGTSEGFKLQITRAQMKKLQNNFLKAIVKLARDCMKDGKGKWYIA